WHLYSQFFDDGGPIKLTLVFAPNANYKLLGKTTESPKPHMEKDEVFEVMVGYFSTEATFSQKIKVLSEKDFNINLTIEGQACYEKDGKCIMVEGENTFAVKGVKQTAETSGVVTDLK
ncbi:MAG TPA: hypothetical protein DCQ31_19285, partial [Bacteroidales bacterium]|nr:hypothetical protein [Bacteroidales bacterium]